MGWDLIIVPSATKKEKNLTPVGHVCYVKEREDKLGNDKIIVAPGGNLKPEDKETITSFFDRMQQFDPVEWY